MTDTTDGDASEAAEGADVAGGAEERGRRMNRSIVIAVGVSVLLFVALGFLFTRGGSSPNPQRVATATMEPVDGADVGDAQVDARLVRDGADVRLVLTARDLPAATDGDHYELWLVDPGGGEPVSLGAVDGSISVAVPAAVDLDAYDVVDITIQPEGDTGHSGESVLTGTLA